MKLFRAAGATFSALSIAIGFAACSSEGGGGPAPTAGASAVAGSTALGGSPSSAGGASAAAGATTQGGAGTSAAQGGQAGTSVAGAGSSGGGAGGAPSAGSAGTAAGGNAGASGGSAGAASAGGSSGQGSAGSGGMAGGTGGPEAELNGAGWTMKCNKVDTAPDAENRCYLLPPGASKCPADGYTSVDQTLHFGGTPGTHYQVTIRFQGTHEAGDYSGGTADPKQFLRGATHISTGVHTWLSMEVSSPAATYNPNSGGGAGSIQVYDYVATIPIDGGATIRLKAFDKDCLMHRYCEGNNWMNCKGLVQPPISPANAPIDGSFLQMTVTSVVAK